jgi:hypothetical protein
MALSNSTEFDDLVEECFGPLLKEGTLQYIQKELIGNEDNIGLVIIKRCCLEDLSNENEDCYINEQYKILDKIFKLNLTYSYVLLVIVFSSIEEFNKIFSEFPLKFVFSGYGDFLYTSTQKGTKNIESLKTFLYPVSIKPAKRI